MRLRHSRIARVCFMHTSVVVALNSLYHEASNTWVLCSVYGAYSQTPEVLIFKRLTTAYHGLIGKERYGIYTLHIISR